MGKPLVAANEVVHAGGSKLPSDAVSRETSPTRDVALQHSTPVTGRRKRKAATACCLRRMELIHNNQL